MNKETVLKILRDAEDFVSGQRLATELGVSRNTIWKQIKALEAEGYHIRSITNRGYRLVKTTQKLNHAEIIRYGFLPPEHLKVFATLPSTNDWVKEHQAELESGTVVMTSHQSQGRGRQGRTFHSPADDGIYFSILYKGELTPRPDYVTITAATAVARVLEEMGFSPAIKWVNDIYIGHRKICGILTEGELELETGQMKYLVLGLGINVNNETFPGELQEIATSLKLTGGPPIDLNELAARLLAELSKAMEQLMPGQSEEDYQRSVQKIIQDFNLRLYLKGHQVSLLVGTDLKVSGKLIGTNDKGHLVLETPEGQRSFPYGEYRLSAKST